MEGRKVECEAEEGGRRKEEGGREEGGRREGGKKEATGF